MHRIVFIEPDGSRKEVEATAGTSLMMAALDNGVDGILGECGGNAACATCHVYVEPGYVTQLPPVTDTEGQMLDATASERLPNSRLSCQIFISPELDGIEVLIPAEQN